MKRIVPWLAIGLLFGCGGATPPNPPPPPAPGMISLALNTGNTAIQQGESAPVTVLITRAGGFTGAVTLTVEGLPAGVTTAQTNETTTGSTTTITLTFSVGAGAAPGLTNLTIRARGTGVADAIGSFGLTVTAAPLPSYELRATGSPITIPQGGNGQVALTIARSGGFAGNVTLTVEGAPVGLATSLSPTATTGTTATLTIVAGAALPAGTYPLTIRGTTAALADKVVVVTVTVTAVTGSGNVVFDFSNCGSPYAIWGAYRDGSGPWTPVTATAGVFRFSVASPLAEFAYVIRQGGSSVTTTVVHFMTRAEMSAAPIVACPTLPINAKIINGSVTGLTGQQAVLLNLGGAIGNPSALFPTFTLAGVPNGDRDLVAYRFATIPAATDRIIVRRDLNIANGGTIPPLDFGAAEAVAPAAATMTIAGSVPGEAMLQEMYYLARSSCDRGLMYLTAALPTSPIFGVPSGAQRPDDYHQIRISAATGGSSRTVTQSFRALIDRTVTLGPSLGNPVVTLLGANYKRLQASFGFPIEYTAPVLFRYITTTGIPRVVELNATPAWVGSTAAVVTMPDFSAVAGWSDVWAPAIGAPTRWAIVATGGDVKVPSCGEGVRVIEATVTATN
ncbi:MAG: hypothetical protein SFV24_17530 [Gemmatimonadales bacterium]|nr:hypothetical protein [Gemmatimonadales bacterium]